MQTTAYQVPLGKTQIFLSYAREDKDDVERLYEKLKSAGFQPWMDSKDIKPGEHWETSIEMAISHSHFFVACLSAQSVLKRGFTQKEIKRALDIWEGMQPTDIYLIPVRLEDCNVPPILKDLEWVDLFEPDGWDRLKQAIEEGLRRRTTTTNEIERYYSSGTRALLRGNLAQAVQDFQHVIKLDSTYRQALSRLRDAKRELERQNLWKGIRLFSLLLGITACMLIVRSLGEYWLISINPSSASTLTPSSASILNWTLIPTTMIPIANSITPRLLTTTFTPTFTPFPPTLTPSRTPTLGLVARGKIAFHSLREGSRQINIMNADGGQVVALTNFRDHKANSSPEWSPDGRRIAFYSNRDGNNEIYVMNGDGTNQTNLTKHNKDDVDPTWSPDGTMIAFVSNRDLNDEIYIMNADGSNQRRLTNNPSHDWSPAWSPDGNWIAFQTDRDGSFQIYLINVKTGEQRNLSKNRYEDIYPAWSPDGETISFSSTRRGKNEIYIMDKNGNDQRKPTGDSPLLGYVSAWARDGKFLAFESEQSGKYEIYILDMVTLKETRLTSTSWDNAHPSWSLP